MTLLRLRAPADDGGVLAVPPLDALAETLASNRAKLDLPARPNLYFAPEAVAQAVEYQRAAGSYLPDVHSQRLIVAGHQPELFHPGVWLKNFALGRVARDHRLVPLNIVADTDTLKTPSIRLPLGVGSSDPGDVRLTNLAYDVAAGEVPFEERTIRDRATFESFGDRLAEATRDWPFEPMGVRFWPRVVAQAARTDNLGECLAAARRCVERDWGLANLELPTSRLARTRAFRYFTSVVLNELPAFHAAYNACVGEYRRDHRIRSRNHPAPDLGRDGDWLETPFWGWRAGSQRRGRLFARRAGDRLELRVPGEAWPSAPADNVLDGLEPLEGQGYKLRPRALTLTMFARLFLADLFVHGIGGGKYDELTDAIIARFFQVVPPAYMVLTGTLRLPVAGFPSTEADVGRLHRLARDLRWNPHRHLPTGVGDAGRLEARAMQQRQQPHDRPGKLARYGALRTLTEQLRGNVAPQIAAADVALSAAKGEVAANAVLRRRDYSFVLYPERGLREFLAARV